MPTSATVIKDLRRRKLLVVASLLLSHLVVVVIVVALPAPRRRCYSSLAAAAVMATSTYLPSSSPLGLRCTSTGSLVVAAAMAVGVGLRRRD